MLLPGPLDVLALQQSQLADESLSRLARADDVVEEAVTRGTERRIELVLVRTYLLRSCNSSSIQT